MTLAPIRPTLVADSVEDALDWAFWLIGPSADATATLAALNADLGATPDRVTVCLHSGDPIGFNGRVTHADRGNLINDPHKPPPRRDPRCGLRGPRNAGRGHEDPVQPRSQHSPRRPRRTRSS